MKRKPAKKKPGRKPLPPEQRRRPVEITLPPEVIEMARDIGDDNISNGVEIAVRAAYFNAGRGAL